MFQLTKDELENWRSQIVTSNPGARMGLRRPPYVFTEHGALQLASVLKSERAVEMSLLVVPRICPLARTTRNQQGAGRTVQKTRTAARYV